MGDRLRGRDGRREVLEFVVVDDELNGRPCKEKRDDGGGEDVRHKLESLRLDG